MKETGRSFFGSLLPGDLSVVAILCSISGELSELVLGPFEFSSFGTIMGYRTLVSDFLRLRLESFPGSVPGPPVRRSCDSDIGRLVIRSVGLWELFKEGCDADR